MRALLEEAMRLAKASRGDPLVAVSFRVDLPRSETDWIEAPLADFVWDTRASDAVLGELVVGLGCAVKLSASGEDRFRDLEVRARETYREMILVGDASPRFFGGLAFEAGVDGPWSEFGDASFVMPRVTLETAENRARITLVTRSSEFLSIDALMEELGRVIDLGARDRSDGSSAKAPRAVDEPADRFIGIVDRALEAIADGALTKVVLSRSTRVSSNAPPELARVLAALASEQSTTRFAVTRGALSFVGATPERLVQVRDGRVETEALAGTIERKADAAFERAELLASEKDLREHAWVVHAIREALQELATDVRSEASPSVRSLKRVHHLATPIAATLDRPVHVLQLVRALHPTPAVSGWPVLKAIRAIRVLEGKSRGWYASPIGWFDARGEGLFVVGIRSALLDADGATVFAGAGIVKGSDPRSEWDETRIKQASMLAALGVL